MESLRKRRNHTELTAEIVTSIKGQVTAMLDQQDDYEQEIASMQAKITSQIEKLIVAFQEDSKGSSKQPEVEERRERTFSSGTASETRSSPVPKRESFRKIGKSPGREK